MTCTQAMNSWPSNRNCAAAPPRTRTSHSAACTMLFVVTTRTAPIAMNTAKIQKKTFCATTIAALSRRRDPACESLLGLLDFGAELEGFGLGHRELPLAEALHVVQ